MVPFKKTVGAVRGIMGRVEVQETDSLDDTDLLMLIRSSGMLSCTTGNLTCNLIIFACLVFTSVC